MSDIKQDLLDFETDAMSPPANEAVGELAHRAANEIDRLRTALAQAERENEKLQHDIHQYVQIASDLVAERDEARGLLREAKGWCPQPESVGQAGAFTPRQRTSLRDRINAHLRDTGE